MTQNWQPLHQEFAYWRASGLTLPVWWRDDDAITVTPQLDQLVDLSERIGLPVHLAVIPRDADAKLAEPRPGHARPDPGRSRLGPPEPCPAR